MENEFFYAGIGSRETPAEVLAIMTALAAALARAGWTLRSGAAPGADTAFEDGARSVGGKMEIFLPWAGFNGNRSRLVDVTAEALAMAATIHPAWENLGQGPRKLHARNCNQVLGQTLDKPVEMTVCWTKDGCESEKTRRRDTGGTGSAIVLSDRKGIPVFNLKNEASRVRLNAVLAAHGIAYQVPLESGKQFSMF